MHQCLLAMNQIHCCLRYLAKLYFVWWRTLQVFHQIIYLKPRNMSLELFWINQFGNAPTSLLCEMSIYWSSFWYWRKLGIRLHLSKFNLQLRRMRDFNWNVGNHCSFSVSTCVLGLVEEIYRTWSFEWLAKVLNENEPCRSLPKRDKYERDVIFLMKDGKLPLNWFWERSRTWRFLKMLIHLGILPLNLFELRPNSIRSWISHNPEKVIK